VSAEPPPEAPRGGRGEGRRRNGPERLPGETEPLNAVRNANGARTDADARKKAEEVEAKRKAEEAEARRKKKEDEERDAELAAYYQEQWANEEDGPVPDGAEGEAAPLSRRESGLRCDVAENPGWGEFTLPSATQLVFPVM
jgi:nucleobase transporter 1/2